MTPGSFCKRAPSPRMPGKEGAGGSSGHAARGSRSGQAVRTLTGRAHAGVGDGGGMTSLRARSGGHAGRRDVPLCCFKRARGPEASGALKLPACRSWSVETTSSDWESVRALGQFGLHPNSPSYFALPADSGPGRPAGCKDCYVSPNAVGRKLPEGPWTGSRRCSASRAQLPRARQGPGGEPCVRPGETAGGGGYVSGSPSFPRASSVEHRSLPAL